MKQVKFYKNILKSFFIKVLIIFFILTNSSYAYLDPGSGSIILQALAFIGSFILILWSKIKITLSYFIEKIKSIFFKKKDSKNKKNS